MLPYRLRPPGLVGKRKSSSNRKFAPNQDPLEGGGPVQVAFDKDLMDFYQAFCQELQSQSVDETVLARGSAFQLFLNLFGAHKIALVHTVTVPPRCDASAYSQLLYATCLSVIRRAFQQQQEEEQVESFKMACFGLYSLFAMYQTNPLPTADESSNSDNNNNSDYHLLPMGLQGDNPKKMYRRVYAPKIRIDVQHYILLQRLEADAVTIVNDCSACGPGASASSCTNMTCALSRDALEVLQRLGTWWDFCEYTGPVGLEGLAGHADYPIQCLPTAATYCKQNSTAGLLLSDSAAIQQELQKKQTFATDWHNVTSTVDDYDKCLKQVKQSMLESTASSKTHQHGRIQEALGPLLVSKESYNWARIAERLGKSRASGTSATMTTSTTRVIDMSSQGQESIPPASAAANEQTLSVQSHADDDMIDNGRTAVTYRLTLPSSLDDVVQVGIQKAMDSFLLRLGQDAVLGTAAGRGVQQELPATIGRRKVDEDDVSSIGQGGISVAKPRRGPSAKAASDQEEVSAAPTTTTEVTGQGRAALRALLASTRKHESAPPIATIRKRRDEIETRNNNLFLLMDEAASDRDSVGDESDLSSVSASSGDEVSVATSAIGQSALKALLSSVSNDHKGNTKGVAKGRKRKTAPARAKKDSAVVARKDSKKQRRKPQVESIPGDASIDTRPSIGRTALDHLLSQVEAGPEEEQEEMST